MHERLKRLMSGCEELFALLRFEAIPFWVDWGTLLGVARHRNIIPWDYDADLCMLEPDYQRLLTRFRTAGGRIGSLVLDPAAYDDPRGCSGITFTDWDPDDLGIDLVAYEQGPTLTRSLMSDAVVTAYPGDYDFVTADLFPLERKLLLGGLVSVPRLYEQRLRGIFGDWQRYPDGESESEVTLAPFVEVGDVPRAGQPWIQGKTGEDRDGCETWWLSPVAPETDRPSFTDLVFARNRQLWGRVAVALIHPGEVLNVPDGWWSMCAEGGASLQPAEERAART